MPEVEFIDPPTIDAEAVATLEAFIAEVQSGRRQYQDDRAMLAAVTMKAATLGLDARAVDQVLARSAGVSTSLGSVSRSLVASLVASARDHLDSTLTTAGGGRRELKLRAARRLVGILLAPVSDETLDAAGLKRTQLPGLKRALAAIGLGLMAQADFGRDDVLASRNWLAAQLGISPRQAQYTSQRLVALGWIRRVKTAGQVPVFKLARLDPAQKALAEGPYRSVVTALVEDALDPVADVIRTATHPVLGYSVGLSRGTWITALADAAGLRGKVCIAIGGPKLRPAPAREASQSGGLVTWLDSHPGLADALAARTVAAETLAQRGRDHRADLAMRREKATVKRKMRRLLTRVYDRIGGVPPTSDGQQILTDWAQSLVGTVRSLEWSSCEFRAAAQELIEADVTRLGWPAQVGERIAALAVAEQEGTER